MEERGRREVKVSFKNEPCDWKKASRGFLTHRGRKDGGKRRRRGKGGGNADL